MKADKKSTDCYHCGLPVEDPLRWTVTIKDQQQPMCCPGCQAVAQTIINGGFDNYYQFRTEMPNQAQAAQDDFTLYNNNDFQKNFVTSGKTANEKITSLLISDIHCAACCWLIENALQTHHGITKVTVSLTSHKATIHWKENEITLSEIAQHIAALGYNPLPWTPDNLQLQAKKDNQQQLRRLGVAFIAMMQAGMFSIALYAGDFQGIAAEHRDFMRWVSLIITSAVVFYSATPFYRGALRSLKTKGNFLLKLGMDTPISIAIISAYIASLHATIFKLPHVYFDSVCMFVFLLTLARYLENRSRMADTLQGLKYSVPESCHRLINENTRTTETIPLSAIELGNRLLIKPGETIPSDGLILEGDTDVNESAFSGEEEPRKKGTGDKVFASTINCDGTLIIEVSELPQHSRFSMIQRMTETALQEKPAISQLADRLASLFTLFVIISAAVAGLFWSQIDPDKTFAIILAMLVVSCPCALSLATPSALTFCYSALKKAGVVICKPHVIEQCQKIDSIIFDKTGTLTSGQLTITETQYTGDLKPQLCNTIAAAMEQISEHPIASAFNIFDTNLSISDSVIHHGCGIEASIALPEQSDTFRIGSESYCQEICSGVKPEITQQQEVRGRKIWLVNSKEWLSCFFLQDDLRLSAKPTVQWLQALPYISNIEILSGDQHNKVSELATLLKIDHFYAECTPEAKLQHITDLQEQRHSVLMVGDGINDIPVMARADLSVAMESASDLAKVKSDAIIIQDNLTPLIHLFSHSKKTRNIIRQNIIWAVSYNFTALPLAAFGLIPPWAAAIGMSASSLLVTLNAMRTRTLQT